MASYQLSFTLKPVLIAVGSLLEASTKNAVCWGTGMAQQNKIPSGGRFIMTRGFLSKKILEDSGYTVESKICGDPAFLMPVIFNPVVANNKQKVGIIPHVSQVEVVKNILSKKNEFEIIDFRSTNVEENISILKSCSFVYSSSLHGIILCHAYGIPCLWFYFTELGGGKFKFYDYLSSVGIEKYEPLTLDEVISGKRLPIDYELVSSSVIKTIQKELLKRAPFVVKKKYDSY